MLEDWMIVFLAGWTLLTILFIAEGLYYALRWVRGLFTIDRDGEVIEIHANKANPL